MTDTALDQAKLCDGYLRLSDGRDLSSLPAREKALRREIARRGWTVGEIISENDLTTGKTRSASAFKRRRITLPNGQTAMRVVRPGFRRILDRLATGQSQAMLAEDLDRVCRDPRDGEDLLDVVEQTRATVDSVSESLKLTNGGTDSEVYAFRGSVNAANKSSKDTGRRVRAARERQADEGIWSGGRRPFGFTPVQHPDGKYTNTRLDIDPVEAAEIVKAADQVLAGIPLKQIARDLNQREPEVPTVTGTRWTAETLRDVLMKPLIAGIVVHRGQETDVRLAGEPILAEDVWRSVVRRLTDPDDVVTYLDSRGRTRKVARGAGVGRAPCHLLTNLAQCVCGSRMEIQTGTTRAPAYRCAREGGTGNLHVRRNAAALERFVADLLITRYSRRDTASVFVAPRSTVDAPALRAEVKRIEDKLLGVQADYDGDVMPRPVYLASMKRHRATLDVLTAQLASVSSVDPAAALVGAADVRGRWEDMSLGQKRAIIEKRMVVTVLPAGRGRGFDPECVRVEWK